MIVTVCRTRLRDEGRQAYADLGPRIADLARGMPGHVSHKTFVAEDGERLTRVEFEDEASQRAWASQPGSLAAQQQGRADLYAEYSLQICEVLRALRFTHS